MALDEHTRRHLDELGALDAPKPYLSGPEAARAGMRRRQDGDPPGPAMASVSETEVPVDGGSILLRTLTPHGDTTATVLFYHGGGWVTGDIDGFDATGRRLADATGCEVVMVEYRLAPEHVYPTAVEDAWAALRHVHDARPGRRLAVAGDSAGGNLAAAVALRARDAGLPLAAQILVYPVVDADLTRPSYVDAENQLLLDAATMRWFWDQYAPDAATRRHPDAAPLHARDHAGLAPAVVVTAEHDVLRDEGEAYAAALVTAGVPVSFRRFPGQLHGFLGMALLPGSARAMAFIGRATRDMLAEAVPELTGAAS